ncbi:MAG: outer membrane beta-barrel protein [Legionellaceae bacterium]|nr:outer membrane beta-barrel protein [Legionellaceae bacterium]
MKNYLCWALCSTVMFHSAYAGTMLSNKHAWKPFVAVSGGSASVIRMGSTQSFPIVDPAEDEFYVYTPQGGTQTKGLFEAFLGGEFNVLPSWFIQAGAAYAQAGRYNTQGILTQGIDAQSADQYTYQFNTVVHQVLAQAKVMKRWNNKLYPYALLGLGASFQDASSFSTSVPPFLSFTRAYTDNTTGSFSYQVGAGIDVDIAKHVRLGIGYRFADFGETRLGSASINNTFVSGRLGQSPLYANEAIAQLTYVL